MSGGAADGEVSLAAIHRWFEAHDLLPAGGAPADEAEVQQQIAVLERGADAGQELLRALIVLAHSEAIAAVEALRRYLASPHPGYEELAQLALEEAEFWAVEVLAPPQVARGR